MMSNILLLWYMMLCIEGYRFTDDMNLTAVDVIGTYKVISYTY